MCCKMEMDLHFKEFTRTYVYLYSDKQCSIICFAPNLCSVLVYSVVHLILCHTQLGNARVKNMCQILES